MTALTPNDRFVSLSPAAGTTVLAYDFELMLEAGMSVTRIRAGVSTPLVLGVDFSFPSGIGDETGGTLTLAVASLAADVYQLVGAQPEQRLSDFIASEKFSSLKMNADLDGLTIVAQEHRRDIDRSWKSALGSAGRQITAGPDGDVPKYDAAGNLVTSGENVTSILGSTAAAAASAQTAAAQAAAALAAKVAAESAAGAALVNATSRPDATARTFPAYVEYIITGGYAEPDDGGGAQYFEIPLISADQPWHILTNGNTRRWNISFPAAGLDVRALGVFSASANNATALANAIQAAAGKKLVFPDGTFIVDAASPALALDNYTKLEGAGAGRTIIEFRSLDSASHGFSALQKTGIRIQNLTVKSQAQLTGNQNAVYFEDCNDCLVIDAEQLQFSAGFVFYSATAPDDNPTWGNRNKAIRCVSGASRAYGFLSNAQNGAVWDHCEAFGATNLDGFKTGVGNRAHNIVGCYSHDNGADGFDTYDGFIDCVMTNCIAENNAAGGFQFKGTLGGFGGWGTDYVTRDSAVANCIARGNGINGFLFQESRNMALSNLLAVENTGKGFMFNNTQGLQVTGIHALRNTSDGVNLQGNSSRNRFTGVTAEDNSYVDGTVQNGTAHGINIETGSANYFSGVSSFNGTQAGKMGGQGYGIHTNATAGNVFSDYNCTSNMTGEVGGTNPYTNNTFGGHYGSLKVRRGTGFPESVVTGAVGDIFLSTNGGPASVAFIKESGTGTTGWRPVPTESVSADKGDAAASLAVGSAQRVNVWGTPLTAARAVTLSTVQAVNGTRFRIVRSAAATGAFPLNVGTGPLAALYAGQWCDVVYNGSAWILEARGRLVDIEATATVDPASLATGAATTPATITVTGAALGDFVKASFSLSLDGVSLHAYVSAADTVAYFFRNDAGANPADLGSGTLKIRVEK